MNIKIPVGHYIHIIIFIFISFNGFNQTNFKSEADLKKKADELFLEGEYVQAYPLYSQLLSLYPKDHFYNFRFGACVIYADKDKEKAIKYLEYAVSKTDIDVEAHFFLGKAYHINYRFDDAIKSYTNFKNKAGNKKRKLLNPDREIEMCENGKKLLSNITDIIVIEKKEVPRSDFFRSYETGKFGGKILAKPDELKSSYDKKIKESSVIFVPNTTGGEIFYSSYGDNDKNGKDIYKVKRLPNGEFSSPQNIGSPINTPYDEEYPILHPNGRILYFCSKGHNSMGGYDVFKSTFDVATQTWSTPINLDFAINTPDDDILFIADENNEEAYFSSTRSSIGSNIGVYKILMVRKPVDLITIKGNFKHFDEDYDKPVKISVRTLNDNTEIASVTTNTENGEYLINIPKGAKYKFLIEGEGFATQSGVVDVPNMENPRPLKQEMELVNINGEARLMIKNLFDEEITDFAYTPPIDVIRKKARLDVNYNEEEAKRLKEKQTLSQSIAATENKNSNKSSTADKTTENTSVSTSSFTNQQIIEMAKSDVEDLKKEAAALREEADFAYAFAKLKSEDSRNNSSPLSEQYAKEAVLAYNLAIEIDNQATAKEKEAQKAEKYAAEIEKAIKSNSNKEALNILEKQRQELSSDKTEEFGVEGALASLREKANKKRAEAERYETKANESKEDADAIQIEIKAKEAEIAKTKDNTQKEKLNEELKDLKTEYEAVKKQSENFASRSEELRKEAANMEYDVELLTKLLDTYKNEADDAIYADLSTEQKAGLKSDINLLQDKAKQAEQFKLAAANNNSNNTIAVSQQNSISTTSENSNNINKNNQNIPYKHSHLNEDGSIADYHTAYLDDLDKVATIENEFEKNASIATINNNWANTIQAEITYRNENLSKLSKKERKAEEQKIANLELQRDEKRKAASEAQAIVQQLFAATSQKANESNNNTQVAEANKQQPVTNEEQEEEEEDEEVEKVNTNAIASNSQTNLNNTQTGSNNQTITSQNQTQTTINQSQNQTNTQTNVQSSAQVKQNEDNSEESEEDDISPVTATNTQVAQTTTTQQLIASPNVSSPILTSQEYTFTAAQAENKRSQGHALEAELLSRRAQKLRDDAAAMTSEEERKAAFREADELDKKAEEKLVESALAAAKANQAEYLNLESVISNTALKITNKNAPEVDMASLLREEAQYYFNEAKIMRERGLNSDNSTSKLNALERANIIEKDAIEKQQRSLELYAKAANMNVEQALALSNVSTDTNIQNQNVNSNTTASSKKLQSNQTNVQTQVATNNNTASNIQNTTLPTTSQNTNFVAQTSSISTPNTTTQTLSSLNSNQEQQKRNQRIAQLEQQIEEEQKSIDALEEEANDLDKEAADLKKKAEETKKKKDRAVAEEIYRAKNEEAIAKRNDLIKANDNLEKLKEELNELKSQSNTELVQNNQTTKSTIQNRIEEEENEEEEDDVYNDTRPKSNNVIINTNELVNTNSTNTSNNNQSININTNKQLSPSEAARIGASNEWKQYYSLLSNSEAASKKAEIEKQEAINFRKEAFALNQKVEELNEKAEDLEDDEEKEEILANAKQIEEQANSKLTQADAKENSLKQNENLAKELKMQADAYLNSLNPATQENLIAYSNMQNAANVPSSQSISNTTSNTSIAANTSKNLQIDSSNKSSNLNSTYSTNNTINSVPKKYEIPKQLNEEIFDRTNAVVYNESNPIPIDVEMPEGLIFKVQVGAFRNRIPQDLFKGFAPVTGETTPSGLTRYTAGFFKAFETADLAKEVIKGYGYQDAFVVAFYNGKRISINEARQILKNQGVVSSVSAPLTNNQNNVQATNTQTQIISLNNQTTTTNNNVAIDNTIVNEPPLINEPGAAPFRMVEQMQGLLYTVQCGVYTRPVPPSQLFNIQPLLVEKTSNGLLRYTSGVYNDINTAVQAKNRIVEFGIKDAFVTAYYNGKRISISEARALQTSNGNSIFVNSSDLNKMPYQSTNAVINDNRSVVSNNNSNSSITNTTNSNVSNATKQPVTVQGLVTSNQNVDNTKTVYKVQIGAFKEEVPIEIAIIYMRLASKGINYRLREDGFTVYTVGATNSLEEANRLKQEVINEGITDAFLVAFQNDKQVPIIGTINNNNTEIKVINPVNEEEDETNDENEDE
ncbi:MAG: hypothetical protein ACK4IK_07555 [Bacteroidia bacterium]